MRCKIFPTALLLSLALHLSTLANSPEENPVIVPFQLIGHTIFVEATVNGITGNYIMDTGSPDLILNSHCFEGYAGRHMASNIVDIHGRKSPALYFDVEEISIQEARFGDLVALVMDLASIEQLKGITVSGILGFSVFKELELLFDFENRRLLLISLRKNGLPACSYRLHSPTDSFDLAMSGHIPCIQGRVGRETLWLGLDSGSEVNIFLPNIFKNQYLAFRATERVEMMGLTSESRYGTKGLATGFAVGSWEMETVEIVLGDLRCLNKTLAKEVDGILGVPFLMQAKMAINFKRKKLYIWRPGNEQLAENKPLPLEAKLDK